MKKLSRFPNDEQRAYIESQIGYRFSEIKEYDSAIKYYHYSWSRSERYSKQLAAENANALGAIYGIKDYLDSSLFYYEQGMRLFEQAGDSTSSYHVATNLAILYKDMSLYEKALDIAFATVSALSKKPPSRELASCYNTIAVVYARIGEPGKALNFHRNALLVRKKLGLQKSISQSYNNIGEIFASLKQYDSALANLGRSLALKRRLNDGPALPVTLNNIGTTLLELRKFKDAEKYFDEALSIKRAQDDRLGVVATLNNIARAKIYQHNFEKALLFLDESEKIARQTGSLQYIADNLELKITALTAEAQYAKALALSEELKTIQDSLFSLAKIDATLAVEARFEKEKKEQQIELLSRQAERDEAELKANSLWITLLIMSIILVTIIALLVFVLLRTTKHAKARVETLLRELHHRMKNNLQILSGLFILQSHELTDEKAIEAVKTSEGRVNAMALIHKKLYTTETNQDINLKDYITELIDYLVQSYGFANRDLKLDLNVEEFQLDVDKAIPLGLIINELVTNAFKYAFVSQPNPQLKLNVEVQNMKTLVLEVSDNGMMSKPANADSFGMKLVKSMSKDLRGTLNVSHEHGTTFLINIPLLA